MNKILFFSVLFLLVIPFTLSGECEIRPVSHNKMLIGDTEGVFQFQVVDPEAQTENDTVIHASCHLNIYSYGESYDGGAGFAGMNGSILTTQFFPDVEQLHYTNYLGDVVFHVDLSGYEWDTDKEYAWQVECYCLDLSPAADSTHMDTHTCFYGSDGSRTAYLGCSNYGNFTTNDKIFLKDKNNLSFVIIFFLFCFILLYIAFNLEKSHVFLKMIILFVVIFLQVLIGKFGLILTDNTMMMGSGFNLYTAILWFIRIFVIYIFLYFVYSMFDYFGKIPHIKPKTKKK